MSAITSTPVVLSARARVAGSAVRAAAPARVAPARRVQVVCAAKKGAFVFSPFVVVAPPGRTRSLRAGDPTDACGVGSTVARRAFVAGVAARSARVFGDSRVGSVAPEPARLDRRRVCKRHVFPTNI